MIREFNFNPEHGYAVGDYVWPWLYEFSDFVCCRVLDVDHSTYFPLYRVEVLAEVL